jgi:predicted dehydrogenase
MREKEIGVAIVGSGRMGELRAHISAHHPGVRFVACADSDPARAKSVAEKVGAQFHSADNTDEILYTERGVPHVHLAGQDANMVFLGSSTPGSWAVGEFWGPLATETRAWLDHLTTGRPCVLATAEDARRNLEISLAIERSEFSGEKVRLPIER